MNGSLSCCQLFVFLYHAMYRCKRMLTLTSGGKIRIKLETPASGRYRFRRDRRVGGSGAHRLSDRSRVHSWSGRPSTQRGPTRLLQTTHRDTETWSQRDIKTQPTKIQPNETRTIETRTIETCPTETRTIETRPSETRSTAPQHTALCRPTLQRATIGLDGQLKCLCLRATD